MKKRMIVICCIAVLVCSMLAGCGSGSGQNGDDGKAEISVSDQDTDAVSEEISDKAAENQAVLADGEYQVDFNTDSSMFHVNEAYDGKGTLNVENGEMTIHVSLVSKNIVNMYLGTAQEAQDAADDELLQPTTDTVTYSDGMTEEVYGFDIPVLALDEDFSLAIIGTKGTWYDHTVSVSSPEYTDTQAVSETDFSGEQAEASFIEMEDGEYAINVVLEGGSGRSSVTSPCILIVEDGRAYARIQWSSSNYDYMLVGGQKYLPLNEEGNSTFEIPITVFNEPMAVVGDTTAMSVPHEVDYTLTFDSESITSKNATPQEAAKRVVYMVLVIIVACIVVSIINKKRRNRRG